MVKRAKKPKRGNHKPSVLDALLRELLEATNYATSNEAQGRSIIRTVNMSSELKTQLLDRYLSWIDGKKQQDYDLDAAEEIENQYASLAQRRAAFAKMMPVIVQRIRRERSENNEKYR
jgi:hypothetical protein